MKKIVLLLGIVIVIFGYACESKADCYYKTNLGWDSCYTWKPDEENNCGQGCTYSYNNGTLLIKTSSTGGYIKPAIFQSVAYDNNVFPVNVNNVIIDGPARIGDNSFHLHAPISGANGTLVITGIDHHGFGDYTTLTGSIVIPANATFGSIAFHGVTLAEGAKIYCAVENCAQKMIDSCNAYGDADGYRTRYLNVVQTIISDEDKFEQAPEGCDFWSSEGCSKCTNSNYSLEYGYCYRKRYTIQEADAATSDDNENMIEWIFE